MQMNRLTLAIVTACAVCLGACQKESTPAAVEQAAAPAEATAKVSKPVAAVTSGPLSVAPGRLESCDMGAVVTVKWDVRADHPDVTETEVWTGPTTEKLTLFAASAASGELQTGAWTAPGTIFALKNRTSGDEIARVVIDGPACN